MPVSCDGTIGLGEVCDDGNTTSGDGCGNTCQLENGWTCPAPVVRQVPIRGKSSRQRWQVWPRVTSGQAEGNRRPRHDG
jgi:cysteine-rich repeat protein